MIVGHLGLAAGVRGRWPRASLLWLAGATVAPDVIDVAMGVAGICNPSGLYSHTIPAVLLLGAAVGGAAYLWTARPGTAPAARATAAACVLVILLHPVLDLLTGQKLFWPGGEIVGWGLYRRPLVDFLLESACVSLGWLILRRSPGAPRWAARPAALAALVAFQGVLNVELRGLKPNACGAETVLAGPR